MVAARGGSEGLPGKNVRLLLGKPLIAWSIGTARQVPEIDRVVVSTDSRVIADAAVAAGAEAPFLRPAELAGRETGKFQVWQHALQECEKHYGEQYDVFVDIDCTNPLLEASDIADAIAMFRTRRASGVRLDAVLTVARARRNPYFNLLEPDETGALKMSKTIGRPVLARQAAPPVFEHIAGVYVLDPDYLRRAQHLLDGHTEGYEIPQAKALDIDSDSDFALVECLLKRRLGRG